jgi:hypothetical protein
MPRDPAGRFPVQSLIFLLSQKLAGAAFHELSARCGLHLSRAAVLRRRVVPSS